MEIHKMTNRHIIEILEDFPNCVNPREVIGFVGEGRLRIVVDGVEWRSTK
jgi:hypothetical protein